MDLEAKWGLTQPLHGIESPFCRSYRIRTDPHPAANFHPRIARLHLYPARDNRIPLPHPGRRCSIELR